MLLDTQTIFTFLFVEQTFANFLPFSKDQRSITLEIITLKSLILSTHSKTKLKKKVICELLVKNLAVNSYLSSYIVSCTIIYTLLAQSMQLVNLYLPSLYFTFDPGLTVTVNFIFNPREPNVYKPHGFFLGFLATFIRFRVTVLFYHHLYFVIKEINSDSIL